MEEQSNFIRFKFTNAIILYIYIYLYIKTQGLQRIILLMNYLQILNFFKTFIRVYEFLNKTKRWESFKHSISNLSYVVSDQKFFFKNSVFALYIYIYNQFKSHLSFTSLLIISYVFYKIENTVVSSVGCIFNVTENIKLLAMKQN